LFPCLSLAHIHLDGRYPADGFTARNFKRNERIIILSGQFRIFKDSQCFELTKEMSIQVEEGVDYYAFGNGTALVIVQDFTSDSRTEIVECA
jgi:hypothetical protein